MSELISTAQLRINPEHKAYLIHRSAVTKTSVSEYIRRLIEDDKQAYFKETKINI